MSNKIKHVGKNTHRFKSNPLEERFAKVWKRINTLHYSGVRLATLDYLLADDINYPNGEVTPRDAEVAATVIQWLGSPVGQEFLREVITSPEGEKFRVRLAAALG
jgi:hypothetical protein